MLETILVIDDDSDARQSLALTLESRDYLVFSAAGEDTAIIMARRVNPKIIYINLAVAGGKGLEICKKIHGTDQLKNVPVIVLSAFDGAKDPKFTNLYGIVDSLQKPFSAEDIFAKTEHALSIKPADMQPVVPEAGPAEEEFSKDTEEDSDIPPERQTESLSPENPPDYVLERETPVEQVSPNTTRRAVRTRHQTRLPFALIAAVVVVMLGAVGFMFYDGGSLFEKILGKTDKPVQPSRQQTVQSNPAADIQQPPQSTGPIQPLAKPESVPAPPVAREKAPNPDPVKPEMAVKPEAKSRTINAPPPAPKAKTMDSGKAVYSVQIGVFKNKKNASTLTKRYEKKGYEAFMHKSSTGEKKFVYRVLIGKFAGRDEAAGWAKKISAEERTKATVFKR